MAVGRLDVAGQGRGGGPQVPQTGRVLIQNNVEIGASTTIDRGSLRDTVIGGSSIMRGIGKSR